jgi:hypothetical protein
LKVASGHCIFSHVRSRQDDLSIRGDNLGCRTLSTQPALMTLDFDDASLFTTCRYGLKFIFNCRERGTKENAVKAYEYHSRNWVTIVQHHRSKADIAHDAQTFDDVQLTLIRLDALSRDYLSNTCIRGDVNHCLAYTALCPLLSILRLSLVHHQCVPSWKFVTYTLRAAGGS